MERASLLALRGVRVGYGSREVVRGVDLSVRAGELWAVLGPNGAGKSTLMRACLGLLPTRGGAVEVCGRPLSSFSRRELARSVAWVPQSLEGSAGFTALELALMGRSPHLGSWGLPSAGEVERARAALAELGIEHLAGRSCADLSGGERRLVWLARALVQEPRLLVLDEPTAFLDVRHQVEALRRVRARVEGGLGVVAVLHDVNLAAMLADRVLLLKDGRAVGSGPVAEVLRGETLERLFELPMTRAVSEDGQPLFAPRRSA